MKRAVIVCALLACGDNLGRPDATSIGTIVPCERSEVGPACDAGAIGCSCGAGCTSGVCVDGRCRATCELRAGIPTCDRVTACVARADVVADPQVGVCEPTCDPLTQCARVSATPAACESSDPRVPDRTCAGSRELTCRGLPASALAATDRARPSEGACAPGYVALLDEATGSTRQICAAWCAALETDATPAHAGNAKGDATAVGTLLGQSDPRVGDATCASRATDPSSVCRFVWPLLDGDIPAAFALRYLDTLGVCIAIAHYAYDADGDGRAETPYPDCATLPPRSAATPGAFDDAYDWGCQRRANGFARALELRINTR